MEPELRLSDEHMHMQELLAVCSAEHQLQAREKDFLNNAGCQGSVRMLKECKDNQQTLSSSYCSNITI